MEKVYPSWRYHKELEPNLILNAEEDAKLGREWADTPAAFEIAPATEVPSEHDPKAHKKSKKHKAKEGEEA